MLAAPNSAWRTLRWISFLIIFSYTLQTTKHVCKHYLNDNFYDFSPLARHTKYEWMAYTIETNLCAGLVMEEYSKQNYSFFDHCSQFGLGKPNLIVANNNTKNISILGCTEISMTNNSAQWRASVSKLPSRFGFGRDTTREVVTLTHDIKNPKLQMTVGLDHVSFNISCQDTVFEDTGSVSDRLYQLVYSGPGGCPLTIKDYPAFYHKNFLFLALMLLPSLIGIFLTKKHERFAMSLASTQAAVMVAAGFCVRIETESGLIQDNSFYYGIAAVASAILSFGLSFFSRTVSILFVSLGLNYAINWTFFYLYSLIFSKAISFLVFAICITVGVPIVIGVSYYFPRARERYSFGIYTSVTYSFYLVTSVAIYFGYYLDVLTFQKYVEFGKTDKVEWKHWICIPSQFVLTLALALTKCSSIKSTKNMMSSTIDSQIFERKSTKDVEADLLAHAYRPDHEPDRRPDISRESCKKTIIAM